MVIFGQISPQASANLADSNMSSRPTLVDLLVDSQLDWRQLISEANNREPIGRHLNESQIKRQEIIHELIQTERHHCLTLALMRQVYLAGLLKLNELRQRNNSTTSTTATTTTTAATTTPTSTLTSGAGAAGQQQPLVVAAKSASSSQGASGGKQASQQQLIVCSSSSSVDNNQHQASQSSLLIAAGGSGGEPIDIERLFPALEELIQAHELFFAHLRLRLVDCCSQSNQSRNNNSNNNNNNPAHAPLIGIIGPLGDLLIDQFKLAPDSSQTPLSSSSFAANRSSSGKRCQARPATGASIVGGPGGAIRSAGQTTTTTTNGHKLLQAYAKFCGQHYESSRYYKQLMQYDKGFKQFIEVSVHHFVVFAPLDLTPIQSPNSLPIGDNNRVFVVVFVFVVVAMGSFCGLNGNIETNWRPR